MTFLSNKRIEGLILLLIGGISLVGGVFLKWWNLYNTAQPDVFSIFRVFILLTCLLCFLGVWKASYRKSLLLFAGISGFILPLTAIFIISLSSPIITYQAIQANMSADMLLHDLKVNDFNPYISWKVDPLLSTDRRLLDNQFTMIDACESLSYCLSIGWYLSIFGGLLLIAGVWCLGANEARIPARKILTVYGALLMAIGLYLGARVGVSTYYWDKARTAHAKGWYHKALDYNRLAVMWDKRLDYDIAYHYELGDLYARLGMTNEPDYWAAIGDNYLNLNRVHEAYRLYTIHLSPQKGDYSGAAFTLNQRFTNCLNLYAISCFNNHNTLTALSTWNIACLNNPDNVQTLYYKALSETANQQYKEAVKDWKNLIALNEKVGLFQLKTDVSTTYRKPITSRAWIKLSYCYMQLGDFNRAQICRDFSTTAGKSDFNRLDN